MNKARVYVRVGDKEIKSAKQNLMESIDQAVTRFYKDCMSTTVRSAKRPLSIDWKSMFPSRSYREMLNEHNAKKRLERLRMCKPGPQKLRSDFKKKYVI